MFPKAPPLKLSLQNSQESGRIASLKYVKIGLTKPLQKKQVGYFLEE